MTNRAVAAVAAACFVAGAALLSMADGDATHGSMMRAAATALMVLPTGLASNTLARRRRHDRRQDDPSSPEFQAARTAGAAAFRDCLVLAAALILALAVRPGPTLALWGFGFLSVAVADYWVRYRSALTRAGD